MSESKTGCVSHLPNDNFLVGRKQYKDICDDSIHAAIMLAYFESWHNHNISSAKEGSRKTLLQKHTQVGLVDAMMGLCSKDKIIKLNRLLVEKGYIKICDRPESEYWAHDNIYDNSNWYLYCPEKVQDALKKLKEKRDNDLRKFAEAKPKRPRCRNIDNEKSPSSKNRQRENKGLAGFSLSENRQSRCRNIDNIILREKHNKAAKQYAMSLSWGMGYSQPEFIDVAAAFSSEIKNEIENGRAHCQAQLPVAEQSSEIAKHTENAKRGISNIESASQTIKPGIAAAVVDAEQATDGEVTQAKEPQPTAKPTQRTSHSRSPAKPVGQKPSNAKATNVVEPLIGKSLADGQMAALVRLAESINTAKPELGVTVQDLERTILNPKAFRECRNQFLKKCNTIKKMALAGRWSPSEAQKPSANRNQWSPDTVAARHSVTADVSDSTNPAVMAMRNRESVDGRVAAIRSSIASIKSTFSDRMSKYRGRQFFVGQMNAIEEKKAMLLELGVDPAEVERLCDVSELVRNLPQMQENITQFPAMGESTPIQRQAIGGVK